MQKASNVYSNGNVKGFFDPFGVAHSHSTYFSINVLSPRDKIENTFSQFVSLINIYSMMQKASNVYRNENIKGFFDSFGVARSLSSFFSINVLSLRNKAVNNIFICINPC